MLISLIAVSTASILIRISNAPPLAIAAYRMIFSTLILTPLFLKEGGLKKLTKIGKSGVLILIGVGIALAIHFASWITSLYLTSVTSSVILVHMDPIIVAVLSHFLLNEKIDRKSVFGIVVAFLGATIIGWKDVERGSLNLYGDLLALVGAIMLGIYIAGGRHMRQHLDLVVYVTPVYATSSLVLLTGGLLTRTQLLGYSIRELFLFLLIAIVPMIFGHTLYNWALKYVSAPIVSLSLLGEPIGASILAYFILGETLTLHILVGGMITLMGITLTVYNN
jgi:drug/metabolite transporter (DMT)-like permease